MATATGAAAVTADLGDLRITRLDSGLTVATERLPEARSVAAGAWVRVGARDEPDALTGVSHFLEHLLFKGTATRSAQELAMTVDRVGGDFNAFTAKEYTAYYCRLPAAHRSLALELLGDVLTAPALRDDDVERERQVILEELAMDADSPDEVAQRRFMAELFAGHPLGRDTAGQEDTVRALGTEEVRAFFARWYRTGATVVSVAGPVDHDEVLAEVGSAFATMAQGDELPQRPPAVAVAGSIVIEDDTEQVHLVTGFGALRRDDPDREALDVLNHVLGGGLSSRLFDQVRERRGLVYSIFSGISAYVDAGALSIYAGAQPHHVGDVVCLIDAELDALRREGITDDELDIAVGALCGSYELGLEDTGACMSRTGRLLATLGEVRPVDEQLDRWRAVRRDDVARVIERVLDGPRVTVAVGPIGHADLLG